MRPLKIFGNIVGCVCWKNRRKICGQGMRLFLSSSEEAYKRVEETKATVRYMDEKVAHYEAILAGLQPDDTNPKNWTAKNRPKHEMEEKG